MVVQIVKVGLGHYNAKGDYKEVELYLILEHTRFVFICVHHGLAFFVNPGESAGQRVKFVFVLFCFICLFLFMLALFVCLFSEFASTPRCQPTPSDTEKMMHNNLPTDNIRT